MENKKNNILIKSINIFICLIPLLLISGPFLPDLSISLASFIFLFFLISKKKYNILNQKFTLIFLVYALYLIILSLNSDNIYLSLESSLFYFRFGLFAILISWLFLNYEKFSIIFFYILIFSFLVLFIDAIYSIFFRENILGYAYDGVRFSSFFRDEKILGSYISRLYPILIFLILYNNLNNKNILISLVGYISVILVVLSGERTAIFIFFGFSILSLIFVNNLKKIFLVNFLVSILIFLLILFINDSIYERFINTTINGFATPEGEFKIFSKNHQSHYLTSLMIFLDNPIFGVGPKMFREVCQYPQYLLYDGCSTHPHNTYMQLLSETGIIGTLPVVIFFLFILRKLFIFVLQNNKIDSSNINIIYLIIFLNLSPFIPSGNFFNNWLNILYFIPIGFLLFSIENQKKII